ncbi:MAG: hypothetical protein K2H23_09285 [Oscillospiraceae bacterium]|nr:hypothetical protein [Oscillospiraceae bacterium]
MKFVKRITSVLSALTVAVGCFTANVSAHDDFVEDVLDYDYDSPMPFAGLVLDSEGNISHDCNYMNIWYETVVDKSFTIGSSRELRIESLAKTDNAINDGRLIITGGAEVELAGQMFIERGGVLEIEDGTLNIHGGHLTNCGIIIIGKNGRLNVESGTLMSQAAGEIENNGIISCMNTRKSLNAAFKKIAKTDEHFNLSDYWLHIWAHGTYADVWLNYCIGDIKTDYSYKFKTDVNYDKIKIKRKPYDMKKVYGKSAEKKLLDRIEDFEDSADYAKNIKIGFYRDYGYEYSYKTDKLFFEACWFTFDYDDFGEMFYDGVYYKDL